MFGFGPIGSSLFGGMAWILRDASHRHRRKQAQQRYEKERAEAAAEAAELVALVKKACSCPPRLIRGSGERQFLRDVTDRLAEYQDRICVSEKQFNWLQRIADRVDQEEKRLAAPGVADIKGESK